MERKWSVMFLAVAAMVGAHGCSSDPVSPSVPVTMELNSTVALTVRSAMIQVIASPRDTTRRLAPNERMTASIRASGGDEEELVFRRYFCGWTLCHTFSFGMKPGWSAFDVVDLAPAIKARVVNVGFFADGGSVTILSGSLRAAMDRARRWPGVRVVEPAAVYCLAVFGNECPAQHVLEAVLATAPGQVRGHDGLLQIGRGEQVTFTYTQPDGSALTRTAVWNPNQ